MAAMFTPSSPQVDAAPADDAGPRDEGRRPRILVVEDDRGLRQSLRRVLEGAGYQVETAGDAFVAVERIAETQPHLVVLDQMLPRGDGLELCRRIRRRPGGRDVAVVMLTARDAVADRLAGFEAGADDYVIKPFALEELLARVKAQLRRVWRPATEVLRFADLELDTGEQVARRCERTIDLTTTEYHLLDLFMRHPQRVLTRQVIGEHLWGVDFEAESNVIDVYVRRLRRKLEANGEAPIIQTVRGSGYALREQPYDVALP
ncbi:MAG: response regulator transcription factor [Chloroflexota bacterium]